MVSLDDLDETYIKGSYIADSADVEATISALNLQMHRSELDVYLSIGDIIYKITVNSDYKSDAEDSIFSFLNEINVVSELPDLSAMDSFSLVNLLEGSTVTVTVNDSLDTLQFTEEGYEYNIVEVESVSKSEKYIQSYERELLRWKEYQSQKNNKEGWKTTIDSVEPLSEDTIEITVDAFSDFSWEVDIPDTRDRSESAVVDYIEQVGKPSLLRGEYVIIVHKSDVEYEINVLSEEDEWCIMKPEVYLTVMHSNTSKVYGKVSKSDRSVESSSSSGSPDTLFLVLVILFGVCLGLIGLSEPSVESDSIQEVENPAIVGQSEEPDSSSNLEYSEDKDLSYSVDVDHEYPDGRFSLILSDNPEELLVQASSTQYEFNDRTLIHLYPEGSDAKYTYNPSETVTIIARDSQGGQKTIFYNTSNKYERINP